MRMRKVTTRCYYIRNAKAIKTWPDMNDPISLIDQSVDASLVSMLVSGDWEYPAHAVGMQTCKSRLPLLTIPFADFFFGRFHPSR
jgi:hypothetical protein